MDLVGRDFSIMLFKVRTLFLLEIVCTMAQNNFIWTRNLQSTIQPSIKREHKIKSNQLFGCSILINGSYESDSSRLDLSGIDHKSEPPFCRAQKKYFKPIINAACNSCNVALKRKKGMLDISSDALYDHS